MPGKNKQILLCNFDFPPNQGIGGRRWAKLCKGLVNEGYFVHVIKAKPLKSNIDSGWTLDTIHPNIRIYELPRTYPEIVSHTGKDIISRIRYKLAISRLKRIERGTIYDLAIGWESLFHEKATSLIREFDIQNLIATGAPWNILYYSARLKQRLPGLNFIADYRDPWITARNYGMAGLDPERMKSEKEKQELVFSQANYITCPNEHLLSEIKKSVQNKYSSSAQMYVIGHSFDHDDYSELELKGRSEKKIRFVYGGALYVEMEKYFDSFMRFLEELKETNINAFNKMEFLIFTDNQKEAEPFRKYSNVHISMPVGKKILSEILSADFCMLLLSHHNKDFRTTKFYEFLPLRKPFVFIGPEGETSRLIEEENLGYVIRNFKKDFLKIIEDFEQRNFTFNHNYNIERHSLQYRVKELEALLK